MALQKNKLLCYIFLVFIIEFNTPEINNPTAIRENMENIINKFHLGVYAIVLNKASILLIKKSRGPYTGKLDLPGGKPEHGEILIQTLVREVDEETHVKIIKEKLFDNYSTIVHQIIGNTQESIHHLGMIYLITSYDDTDLKSEINSEDSLGAQWYAMDSLTQDMLSPFAFKAVMDIKKISL